MVARLERLGWWGPVASLIAVAMAGTLYAFWLYSKVADAYISALFFALLSIWAFQRRDHTPSLANALCVALAAIAATLMHQMYVFLGLAMALAILLDRRAGRARYIQCATGLAMGVAVITGAYVLAYIHENGGWASGAGFVAWAAGHAQGGLWEPPGWNTPLLGLIGAVTTMFTPFPAAELAGHADVSGLTNRSMVEELFVARQALSPTWSVLGLIGLAGAGTVYLIFLVLALHGALRQGLTAFDRLIAGLIVMFIVVVCLWEAINREFWIQILVLLVLFVATKVDWSVGRLWAAGAAVLTMAAVNFSLGIAPLSDRRHDYFAVMIDHIVERTEPEDTIVLDCSWLCAEYLKDRPERRWVSPGLSPDYGQAMEGARRVVMVSWTYHPPTPTLTGRPDDREVFLTTLEATYGRPGFAPPTAPTAFPELQAAEPGQGWKKLAF